MKHAIAWGSLSNYLKIVARIIIGLVTFRLLYGALDQSSFGLYQLLWSTVGYVVLLDFGFGFAVQKSVARSVTEPAAAPSLRRRLTAALSAAAPSAAALARYDISSVFLCAACNIGRGSGCRRLFGALLADIFGC